MTIKLCPDCFRRLRVDEDQELDDVLMIHQMSGACPATDRIIPSRDKSKRKKKAAVKPRRRPLDEDLIPADDDFGLYT